MFVANLLFKGLATTFIQLSELNESKPSALICGQSKPSRIAC